ncbi:predicted protein [Scheffersomyces stipitis CBS 6054]|uniref:A to I editase domain-containing protein n=1 Tax=Scheffersomyces stipitis (strain ATCC 58785 / CBS 6054 / NBRC 10063 / NRRL Y-11545) TaxID=322104 RepID=A3M0L7_PICST|nr:predicted protein [Scheffersomyces stipitis CBS 6054]ABN68549.2 predicted protein [Scheffersomyces stipitis CBS 6054]
MNVDIGQCAIDAVVSVFNGLNVKSGKPVVRSNGIKEWTVLAGVVGFIEKEDGIETVPLTVATGVKALPDKYRDFSDGLFVHDSHAEILALRLFNWFLVEECLKIRNGEKSDVIETLIDSDKFRLKNEVKLGLVVTEPPCGDASMGYLVEGQEDKEPWKDERKEYQENQLPVKRRKLKDISRGRGHFDKLGIVRTKPGRSDSQITLSKSCSDKLCIRQLTGITNSLSSTLFPEKIYLDYLILQKDKFLDDDVKRCFATRFADQLEPEARFRRLQTITYKKDAYDFHKPESKDSSNYSPSPLSLLYVVPYKMVQVLQNGVRNGSFVKGKPPRKGGESFICNRQLYKQLQAVRDVKGNNYIEFKNSLTERNLCKQMATSILHNWTPTSSDSFDFSSI